MSRQPSDEMNVQSEDSQAVPIPGVLGEGTGRERAEELRQVLAAIVESSDDAIIAKLIFDTTK